MLWLLRAIIMASVASTPNTIEGTGWSNIAKAAIEDGDAASITLQPEEIVALYATNFGFDSLIPETAAINGVAVRLVRRNTSILGGVADAGVYLFWADSPQGKGQTIATPWTDTFTSQTYGGASSMWGLDLTYTHIADSSFGVRYQVQGLGEGPGIAEVDLCAEVTVYYTDQSQETGQKVACAQGVLTRLRSN